MYVVSIGDYDSVESTAVRLNLHLLSKQVWNYIMDNDSRVCLFICSGGQSQLLHMASTNGKLHVLKTGELKHCDSHLNPNACPVQCNSVQDNIYVFGKAHMHSTQSLRRFPSIASETVPKFIWLMMALYCLILSRKIVYHFPSPCLSPPDDWLYPHVVSQAH